MDKFLFDKECARLAKVFRKLKYPNTLISASIRNFIDSLESPNDVEPSSKDAIRIILPFNDQESANNVKKRINTLSAQVGISIRPIFTSPKIKSNFGTHEKKPAIINQQCLVYQFKCSLCDAGYVGCRRRHLSSFCW